MASDSRRLKVVCVDDNVLMADALQRRFEADPDLQWGGMTSDEPGTFEWVIRASPDIVLMDIDMPSVDAFALVERLAAHSPSIRVIMFSGHVSREYLDRALDCGAWGYVSKNDEVATLLECVKRVGRGEVVFSSEVSAICKHDGGAATPD